MTNKEYEENRRARQKALGYPLPWRLWSYGIWLADQLPQPQGFFLGITIVWGTIILIVGTCIWLPWLLAGGLSWLFWLLLGMLLAPLFRPLWHVWKSVAQEILAVERLYKKGHDDERL